MKADVVEVRDARKELLSSWWTFDALGLVSNLLELPSTDIR
jgi:hypothetical protein